MFGGPSVRQETLVTEPRQGPYLYIETVLHTMHHLFAVHGQDQPIGIVGKTLPPDSALPVQHHELEY